jgi:hypothetical protein
MTKGGKHGFLGVVAHYVDSKAELRDVLIALPQLTGAHSGEMMAEVVIATLQNFGINAQSIGYFVLDNASNNDCTVKVLPCPCARRPESRGVRGTPKNQTSHQF